MLDLLSFTFFAAAGAAAGGGVVAAAELAVLVDLVLDGSVVVPVPLVVFGVVAVEAVLPVLVEPVLDELVVVVPVPLLVVGVAVVEVAPFVDESDDDGAKSCAPVVTVDADGVVAPGEVVPVSKSNQIIHWR